MLFLFLVNMFYIFGNFQRVKLLIFKSFKGKYEVKMEFQWGGVLNYDIFVGSMDIFWTSIIGLLKVYNEQ